MDQKPYQQKETLELLLVRMGMDKREAAEELGVNRSTVARYAKMHGIKTHFNEFMTEEYLRYLVEERELTHREIADKFNVTTGAIGPLIEKYGMGSSGRGVERKYSDEDMIEWLETYILEYGVEPRDNDLTNWPGPSAGAYRHRFGSLDNALEKVDVSQI